MTLDRMIDVVGSYSVQYPEINFKLNCKEMGALCVAAHG